MKALLGTRSTRRRTVVGLLACLALLTTACAAGQRAQSAEESPSVDAASGTIGHLALRNVAIAAPADGPSYAAGGTALLQFAVINNGETADTLTAITTTAATAVAQAGPSSSSTPATSGTNSATGTSGSDTSSASSTPTATTFAPIPIDADGKISFGAAETDPLMALVGLTDTLYGGNEVRITFTFASAGTITLTVPVQITSSPSPTGLVVSDTGSATAG